MEEVKHKASFNEKGEIVLKSKDKIKQGKYSRAAGARFELKVRAYWENKGWIVDKWSNNVDLESGKLVKAKRKYNPFKKILVVGTGFPDFIVFKPAGNTVYEIIGIEVKLNGLLSKNEKQKCKWILENKIFNEIIVASRGEKRGEIKFEEFSKKYNKLFL